MRNDRIFEIKNCTEKRAQSMVDVFIHLFSAIFMFFSLWSSGKLHREKNMFWIWYTATWVSLILFWQTRLCKASLITFKILGKGGAVSSKYFERQQYFFMNTGLVWHYLINKRFLLPPIFVLVLITIRTETKCWKCDMGAFDNRKLAAQNSKSFFQKSFSYLNFGINQ